MSKPLSESFREMDDSKPDRFTMAWWKKQLEEIKRGYRGATHGINCCIAGYATCQDDFEKLREELRERCAAMEKQREAADAEIAQLRSKGAKMEASLGKARLVYAELQSKMEKVT